MRIQDWPAAERPRERLVAAGAAALSDAELLAIFLRTGVRGKSAVDLARELLVRFGGLARVAAASLDEIRATPGFGLAKYAQLQAGLELARRAIAEPLRQTQALQSPTAVRDYLQLVLRERPYEAFVVIYLDAQHRVIASEELFRGTLAQTSVYPREVARAAIERNAGAVIVAHNHPSGIAEPSPADQALTRALREALGLLDIALLDHFIVAGPACVSFAERGLL